MFLFIKTIRKVAFGTKYEIQAIKFDSYIRSDYRTISYNTYKESITITHFDSKNNSRKEWNLRQGYLFAPYALAENFQNLNDTEQEELITAIENFSKKIIRECHIKPSPLW